MTWSVPETEDLLEARLGAAIQRAIGAPRIQAALAGRSREPVVLIAECLAAPIRSAAEAGFAAVEATLRVDAERYLHAAGVDASSARRALDQAAAFLVPAPSATTATGTFGVGVPFAIGAAVLGLFLVSGAGGSRLAIGAGGAMAAAVAAESYRRRRERQVNRDLAESLPARLAENYRAQLRAGIGRYEAHLRAEVTLREGRR